MALLGVWNQKYAGTAFRTLVTSRPARRCASAAPGPRAELCNGSRWTPPSVSELRAK